MVLYSTQEYDKKIAPFLRNGVIIDTSVILEIMRGVVSTHRNTVDTGWKAEYEKIINLLELIKINNNWKKFFLTPHIMTETCSHINTDYNNDMDFKDIVKQIMSIVEKAQERAVCKEDFMGCINYQNGMVLESGDLSIYAVADSFVKEKKKVAILTIDDGFSTRYYESPYVMVIDYRKMTELG